jgi:phosphate acyltransferase
MGGDNGPSVTLPACRAFLEAHPQAHLILVGKADALAPAAGWPRCTVVAASEVVEMDDPVEVALRRKKDSSLRVAVSQVKLGEDGRAAAQACVSAGNTGALMAVSRYVLKTLEGIDRPAIASVMPNERDGYTTVGLLNIGEEAIKGSETIKQAGELLRAAAASGHLNFHGNVEGNDIFKGTTDIVVCDGFVGNVALKTAEGLASMLSNFIKQEFTRNVFTKLAALVALPVLNHFKARVDHRRYNGAALLGLRGLVFKSHGSADAFAFQTALNRAYDAARNRLLDRVHDRILETLAAMPAPSAEPQTEPPALAASR